MLSDDYLLVESQQEYDVLDRPSSRYTSVKRDNGDEVVVSVLDWSIRQEQIPPLDLFAAIPNDVIVTDTFEAVWRSNGFTGAKFLPVRS